MSVNVGSLNFGNSESFTFDSFGVKIRIRATHLEHLKEILQRLEKALPKNFKLIENERVDHQFFIEFTNRNYLRLYKNDEEVTGGESKSNFFKFLESKIRLTVAEYAESKVFIHAGAVAWKNQALILPGGSFKGKTTLVRELIKRGATYYSDEYAVLDKDGLVHPFPKTLSVRGVIDDFQQTEIPAESFGASVALEPCRVGMVLFTEYKEQAVWKPTILGSGEGVLEIIAHTLPIRLNPKFTLQVLNKVASRAIICKSLRGEADNFAKQILEFFELNT